MAKVYIANRPVRFDRNYKVGEVIPDGVVSPAMGRKLVEMGRLLHVELPDAASEKPGDAPEGGAEAAGTGEENAAVPAAGEFVCEVCGKAFASQNALSAHSKAHKE